MACPKCGSSNVQTINRTVFFLALLSAGGICVFLGFLLPFLWIGALLIPLSPTMFLIKKTRHCNDCNHQWKPNEQEVTA